MKRYRQVFIFIWVLSLAVVVSAQFQSNRINADRKVIEAAGDIVRALEDHERDKGQIPANLSELNNEKLKTENVAYTKTGKKSYKLCVNYKTEKTDYDGKKESKDIRLEYGYIPEAHPKGEVCYTETIKSYTDTYDYRGDDLKDSTYDDQELR